MIKYFCDCCGKEIFKPFDYVDMRVCKCHAVNYDIEIAHFIICPDCRKKIIEKSKS